MTGGALTYAKVGQKTVLLFPGGKFSSNLSKFNEIKIIEAKLVNVIKQLQPPSSDILRASMVIKLRRIESWKSTVKIKTEKNKYLRFQ